MLNGHDGNLLRDALVFCQRERVRLFFAQCEDNRQQALAQVLLALFDKRAGRVRRAMPVSYTHLTLPTIYSV